MIDTLAWSAPGKIVLLGEYGVLARGRALVAAVSARAIGRTVERSSARGVPAHSRVVAAVMEVARSFGHAPLGHEIEIDTASFVGASGEKLGIGSSAVAATLAAALVTGKDDDATLALAVEGHRRATFPSASGIDVVACFLGGFVACARQPGDIEVLAPATFGLTPILFFMGRPASTLSLVPQAQNHPSFIRHAERLASRCEEGIQAWKVKNPGDFLQAVRDTADALRVLGAESRVDIVTASTERLIDWATRMGGAAKPCGAGGGDVAVAWLPARNDLLLIAEEFARNEGLRRLSFGLGDVGLVRIRSDTQRQR